MQRSLVAKFNGRDSLLFLKGNVERSGGNIPRFLGNLIDFFVGVF